jgi:hypothetical protein
MSFLLGTVVPVRSSCRRKAIGTDMNAKRALGVTALAAIVLLWGLTPYFASALSAGQSTTAQLQTQIQIAGSAKGYSSGLLSAASSHGLDVSSARALIVSGNTSLAAAESELVSGSNISAGLQDALIAAKDYSAASVGLGVTLQGSGSVQSADIGSAAGAIVSANATATVLSTVITSVCSTTSVNSTLSSVFAQDCTEGKADVSSSFAALTNASIALMEVESGQVGANISASSALVVQARGNLAQATTVIGELAAYTYASRGEAFVSGPMASQIGRANASVTAQESLSAGFSSATSTFQSDSNEIDGGVDGVTSSASTVSGAISAVDYASIGTSVTAQETTLASIQSDLTLLGEQLPTTLPLTITATLQTDIASAQADLKTYDSALANSGTEAASFPQVTVSGVSGYSTSFQSGTTATEQDGQAFIASYSSLETELSSIAGLFPLLTILAQWNMALTPLGQNASSGSASVDTSLQTMTNTLASLQTGVSSMTTAVQSTSTSVGLSASLIQNVASISSSESAWLNSTGAAAVTNADVSLGSARNMTVDFVASSQALLQLQLSQLGPAAQSLTSQGASLKSQVSVTAETMGSAGTIITGDLQVRLQALASGNALIKQSLSLFGDLQVSQGASLLVQASAQLQIAYSKSA